MSVISSSASESRVNYLLQQGNSLTSTLVSVSEKTDEETKTSDDLKNYTEILDLPFFKNEKCG